MEALLKDLDAYRPQNFKKIKSRKEVLKNANIFFEGREMIIHAFEENIFPLPKRPPSFQGKDDEGEEYILLKEISEIISGKQLFREYFKYQSPSRMYGNLNSTKNTEKIIFK